MVTSKLYRLVFSFAILLLFPAVLSAQEIDGQVLVLSGVSSGSITIAPAPVVGGDFVIELPKGSTDFSSTGGTHQFVKQNTAGGALTVVQPVSADISDLSSNVVTSITGTANQITASASVGAVTLSLPVVISVTTGYQIGGLAPSTHYLRGDGTNYVDNTIQASDVPTLNQNTTGSAAKLTTARTIAGVSFDGTANISIASTGLSDTANIAYLASSNIFTAIQNISRAGNSKFLDLSTSSVGTGYLNLSISNTSGNAIFGVDSSIGGIIASGSLAYSTVLATSNTTAIHIAPNQVVALTAINGGNVGIGLTNPTSKLTLSSGNNTKISNWTGATTGYQYFEAINTGAYLQIGLDNSSGGVFATGATAYSSNIGTANATDLVLFTNQVDRLHITSSGAITDAGNLAVNGGTISSTQTTFNLLNTTATTVNFAGAATTLNIGNSSGTNTIAGNLKYDTSQNFSWNTKALDTVYQAASDGLVVFYAQITAGNTGVWTGLTDSSNPPTTSRTVAGQAGVAIPALETLSVSFTMPVKKGDYWKVLTSVGTGSTGVFWVPLGTAG